MYRAAAIIFLVAGIFLLFWGFRASESLNSDVSRFFTGSPTDNSMWLMMGGFAAAALGVSGLIWSPKQS